MTSSYDHSGRPMSTLNNVDARFGSGGQILSDNTAAANNPSTMHTLQPVVVDSGWPPLMSLDPSTGTIVPNLNAAMMMMMMPQAAAAAQYPVMFTSGQPTASMAEKVSTDGFSQMMNMPGNMQYSMASTGHSTIDVKQLNSLQNVDSWLRQTGGAAAVTGQQTEMKNSPQSMQQSQEKMPTPPKKPLSAYMRFSKQVWQSVKEANPGQSVCEIGGIIGRMWRELTDSDKKVFANEFEQDKNKYDEEVKVYLQATGLKLSDLNKPKPKKPAAKKPAQIPAAADKPNGTMVTSGQAWTGNSGDSSHRNVQSNAGQQMQPVPNGTGMDGMVVYHVSDDGTQECYVERNQNVAEMKPGDDRQRSVAALNADVKQMTQAELIRTVTDLRLELTKVYRCLSDLQQENNLLRQMHDAQATMR